MKGQGPNSITSYISGLNYIQKTLGEKDLLSFPIIKKTLIGLRKRGRRRPPKQAIDIPTLSKLIAATETCLKDIIDIAMTKCYIAMQFFGLFRISELLGDLKLKIPPLLFSNIKINDNLLTTELTQYKHSNGKGAVVKLCRQPSPSICPINLLNNYITLRGSRPGPLFILGNGKPLGKQALASRLRRCCVAAGLPPRTLNSPPTLSKWIGCL